MFVSTALRVGDIKYLINMLEICMVTVIVMGHEYLTIIPRARMGSESIAHEAEGFSKIQLAGQKYRDKTTLAG